MEAGTTDRADRQINWSIPQRCLLLGVAGSGMRALAQILEQAGHTVYGADRTYGVGSESVNGIASEPIVANAQLVPWGSSGLFATIDICVCSSAIPASAPLLKWARGRSIPVLSLHAAVGSLFGDRSQICVTGTHGKSTTSALLAWILNGNGADAGVFVGAQLNGRVEPGPAKEGGHYGRGRVAVIEACEFAHSFLQLDPHQVILNGIDSDHFDCFDAPDTEDAAYAQFLERLPSDGNVFVNATCSRSLLVTAQTGVATVHWMLNDRSSRHWSGNIMAPGSGRMTVRVRHKGRQFGDLRVPLFGRHNAENLLAAVAMASHLGMSAIRVQKSLTDFPGLKRRLEYRGDYHGMRMLDDYAHHPTAVTTTLESVRQQFPGQRLLVLFEPHQLLRLQHCQDQFIQALSLADKVVLLPVFPAREQVSVTTCHRISRELAATISDTGTPAVFADGVNAAVSILDITGQPGDVCLTMGAGTVHRIHDEVHRRFQRDSAA